MPHSYHLPPPDLVEDQPEVDFPTEEQPPPVVHIEEPQIPASSVPAPATIAPLPTTPAFSVPLKPSTPNTTAHTDLAGPSSSAPPPQHITISTRDFLAIMDAIFTFSVTSVSFMAAHAALAERMTHTQAALAQNQAILVHIQSHLGLPLISPSMPAQASSVHPPSIPTPSTQPAPAAPLNLLAAVAVAATLPATPAAPQPTQDEDDLPPATH